METPFIKSYFNSRLIDTIYLFQANAGLGSEVDAELDFFGSALTAVDSSTGIGAGLMKVRLGHPIGNDLIVNAPLAVNIG